MGIVKVDLLASNDGVLEDCLETHSKHYSETDRSSAVPPDESPVLKRCGARHGWNVPGRKPGTDGFAAAAMLRSSSTISLSSGHHSAGPLSENDAPLHAARQGKDIRRLRSSFARTRIETNSGSATVSGTTAPHGPDRREFSGGEAEDLRRAMGFKRFEERMHKIEAKLRTGMTQNRLSPATQDEIITPNYFLRALRIPGIPRGRVSL